MKRINLIISILTYLIINTCIITLLFADTGNYSISGEIHSIKNFPVHIYLVDENTSKIPFTGIKKNIIIPDARDIKSGFIKFCFKNIPEGKYGIRCFQDTDNNGKLDKGLFGPKEPWGLSWNNGKTSGWPSFKNFCFNVSKDISKIVITLNK